MSQISIFNLNYVKLQFDTVTYADGVNYDSSSGIYTASVSGTYFFTFSIVTANMFYCNVCLRKNGVCELVASTDGRIFDASKYNEQTASNMGILHLNSGDQIWIETFECTWMYGNKHSTFSGWKLAWSRSCWKTMHFVLLAISTHRNNCF